MATYKILDVDSLVDFANGKTIDGVTLTAINPPLDSLTQVGSKAEDAVDALNYCDAQGWVLFQAYSEEGETKFVLKHA